jgi:hypothetical protein
MLTVLCLALLCFLALIAARVVYATTQALDTVTLLQAVVEERRPGQKRSQTTYPEYSSFTVCLPTLSLLTDPRLQATQRTDMHTKPKRMNAAARTASYRFWYASPCCWSCLGDRCTECRTMRRILPRTTQPFWQKIVICHVLLKNGFGAEAITESIGSNKKMRAHTHCLPGPAQFRPTCCVYRIEFVLFCNCTNVKCWSGLVS